MPATPHNNVLQRELPIVLQAQWQVQGVLRTIPSTVDGNAKPTLLVGAKRRQKVRSFPKLVMSAALVEQGREAGTMSNVTIDELEGLEVVFRLRNQCTEASAGPSIVYRTRLRDSRARIELSEAEMHDVVFKHDGTLKARVNENLLEFEVEIPAKALDAESSNRVIVMTRRVVVFVPGLLGSTIAVDTKGPDGPVPVYPNIYCSKRRLGAVQQALQMLFGVPVDAIDGAAQILEHRHIEILECDAAGHPLLASDVELFQLAGALPGVALNDFLPEKAFVYDVKDRIEAQWGARIAGTRLPLTPDFLPIRVLPWPYDWRLDLEDSAQALFKMLQQLHENLLHSDDSDDLVALSGHSTGGVINRRVCTLPGVEQLVEHCFFMNAPFRGAPKATSVMLFGGAPPVQGEFEPMMPTPLISAAAMMRVAVNLPILYFLSPNYRYPDCVSTLSPELCQKTGLMPAPDLGENSREVEKRNAVLAAVATGIYQPTRPVPATASEAERVALALGAREWHEVWWTLCRRRAFERAVVGEQVAPARREAQRATLRANANLARQDQLRATTPLAWNEAIARQAAVFHRLSETGIGSSPVGLYVFWSENTRTPGSVDIELEGAESALDREDMASYHQAPDVAPSAAEASGSFDFRFEWWPREGRRQCVKVSGTIVDGDGTVPRASLLGIGSAQAKIFKPIPGDPGHVPAPNRAWVWDRVLDVLCEADVSAHVLSGAAAEPKNRPAPPRKA